MPKKGYALLWYLGKISFMTIDFGSIKSYNPDRGFGFVGHTFFNPNEKVFFHIKKIKKRHPDLSQKLDNGEAFEQFNFWYEIEINEKGEQVSKLWLSTENIPQNYTNELCDLSKKVESIWKNVDAPKPSWLNLVTIELVGVDRRHELSVERDNLESQLRAAEEEQRRDAEAAESLRQNEIRIMAEVHNLTKAKAEELSKLLAEMRPFKFTYSKQLSEYIKEHKLGYRYPNIAGIVRMEEAGTGWDFEGGFPPDIYKIICKELHLSNQGTSARPVKFTPFKDIYQIN
jgi:cold shock CspA family protein